MRKPEAKTVFFFLSLIMFLACSSDDSPEQEQKEEEKEITLEGNYSGTWNSTTDQNAVFTDFLISAKFEFSNNDKTQLRGVFFATAGLSSCCGGDNDGTMIVNLDGDNITSFDFDDTIIGCTGDFEGTGSISSKKPFYTTN